MDLSTFLARVIGVYLIVMSLAMIINAHRVTALITEDNPNFVFIGGIFSFIIGLLIVVSHNIWVAENLVLVTIFGWVMLIRGLWRLFFPTYVLKLMTKFVQNRPLYFIMLVIILLIGFYLTYVGFNS